jgi:hypothetical protein
MILALLLIGLLLIATSLQDTQHELAQRLQTDILGPQGFLLWAVAIGMLSCIGLIPGLQRPTRYMMALLLIVVLLRNNGVFGQAESALKSASAAGPAPAIAAMPAAQSGGTASAVAAGTPPASIGESAKTAGGAVSVASGLAKIGAAIASLF